MAKKKLDTDELILRELKKANKRLRSIDKFGRATLLFFLWLTLVIIFITITSEAGIAVLGASNITWTTYAFYAVISIIVAFFLTKYIILGFILERKDAIKLTFELRQKRKK